METNLGGGAGLCQPFVFCLKLLNVNAQRNMYDPHFILFYLISFFFFLGLGVKWEPWLGVKWEPWLGVKWELWPRASTTATATWGPSHVCNLYLSSWQQWNLNPPSKGQGLNPHTLVGFIIAEP